MEKVHFIGIGGIGLSAIARLMLHKGKIVSGSDREPSLITAELEKLGAKITYGHSAANLPAETRLVVYTVAIGGDNPELVEARKRQIKCQSYPEFLGELSRQKFTIAVAGTHGKTTTTAMLAQILIAAGLDPTVIVGSLIRTQSGEQTNFIPGKSQYLLLEACEYKRSFLNLWPQILVITNVDADHLDYYKDLADIKSAFAELAARAKLTITEQEYLAQPTDFKLLVPGDYNLRNAQAALAAALALGVSREVATRALTHFRGAWRRFEQVGETSQGALVYDDYAHHPTALRAVLKAARATFPTRRLVVVFHPHLYSRTKLLFDDFATAFGEASEVILAPIYAAREVPDQSISSEKLAQAIAAAGPPTRALPDFDSIADYLNASTGDGDLILTVGAGDIYQVAYRLVGREI